MREHEIIAKEVKTKPVEKYKYLGGRLENKCLSMMEKQ